MMTSFAPLAPTALATREAAILIMTSFSLWRHLLLSWPRPALRSNVRYVRTDTLPRLIYKDTISCIISSEIMVGPVFEWNSKGLCVSVWVWVVFSQQYQNQDIYCLLTLDDWQSDTASSQRQEGHGPRCLARPAFGDFQVITQSFIFASDSYLHSIKVEILYKVTQGSVVADKLARRAASWWTCCKQIRWTLSVMNSQRR